MTDAGVSTILGDLDTSVIPSRAQAGKGIYPAVEPLQSSRKRMDRKVLSARHYSLAEGVSEHLARYHGLEDIITMLGIEELPGKDRRIVLRARRRQRSLAQPLQSTASHTGIPGTSVPRSDCLSDCEAFLQGRYDDVPEAQWYRRGTLRRGAP